MASKKLLKKRVKGIVYRTLDTCDYHIVNELPKANEADKLIDHAVDFHDKMVSRINLATAKKEFKDIAAEVEKASKDFNDKLKGLE
ncbi:MAG: hypothetical protein Crog4KO_32020 [Crocinitomicaceae bacterium]